MSSDHMSDRRTIVSAYLHSHWLAILYSYIFTVYFTDQLSVRIADTTTEQLSYLWTLFSSYCYSEHRTD